MNHIGLFEGIGGFSLAARWMGWKTIAWCEYHEFNQRILKYHFPNAEPHGDIRNTDFSIYRGKCQILTGGFPCQPFSSAGKRKGTDDDRYLWPEMLRAVREVSPRWIVGENVDGIFTWSEGMVFETVCADLENEGYEVQAYRIPACATQAPHRRDRWWFVAKNTDSHGRSSIREQRDVSTGNGIGVCVQSDAPNGTGRDVGRHSREPQERQKPESGKCFEQSNVTDTSSKRLAKPGQTGICEFSEKNGTRLHNRPKQSHWDESWIDAATGLCRMDDGLPRRLDGITFPKWRRESLKSYGNAIVPQVAYQIFQAIEETEVALSFIAGA